MLYGKTFPDCPPCANMTWYTCKFSDVCTTMIAQGDTDIVRSANPSHWKKIEDEKENENG